MEHVIVCCKCYDTLLIPKDEFLAKCDVIFTHATFKKNKEWHPMSGGSDTWLQSYAINHARGWSTGKFDESIEVTGIFWLDIDS